MAYENSDGLCGEINSIADIATHEGYVYLGCVEAQAYSFAPEWMTANTLDYSLTDQADWSPLKEDWRTGTIVYRSSNSLHQGQNITMNVHLRFDGNAPENEEARILLGGGYGSVTGGTGYEYEPLNEKSEEKDYIDSFNLLCSSLEWEVSLEAVEPRNIMWKQYNYMVYKATVRNTSSSSEGLIKTLEPLSVTPPVGADSNWGLRAQEAMAWLYDETNASITKNTDFSNEMREKMYIGKPDESGVLIYEVTDVPETERAQWDLSTFEDISYMKDGEKVELSPLPYQYTTNNSVCINTDKIEAGQKKEFYFAFPMMTSGYDPNNARPISLIGDTVRYSTGNNYAWSKYGSNNEQYFLQQR